MLNFHWVFWVWDNDYDGLVGQKNGKNYSRFPLGSFLACWYWSCIRNPVSNWGRYVLGFDYNRCKSIIVSGNWMIASTDEGEYYCYCSDKFQAGWKITFSRMSDRPICGFGFRRFHGDKAIRTQ